MSGAKTAPKDGLLCERVSEFGVTNYGPREVELAEFMPIGQVSVHHRRPCVGDDLQTNAEVCTFCQKSTEQKDCFTHNVRLIPKGVPLFFKINRRQAKI